ncbi:MAG: type II toxin-antitoxin system prevent-host-death family antitoxin, partial [Acidobacteriota bacterium]|nr:type II toxin-antitoxin system prevent-host-death family antitoxin [Acidobacteriota bacterium]
QFGEIMRRARERGERFIVDKRREPQIVILSIEDYLQNVVKQPKSLTRLQRSAKRRGLNTMRMGEIEREVRRIRKELSRDH